MCHTVVQQLLTFGDPAGKKITLLPRKSGVAPRQVKVISRNSPHSVLCDHAGTTISISLKTRAKKGWE